MAATSGSYSYSAQVIGRQTMNVPGYSITLTRKGTIPSSYTISSVTIQKTFSQGSFNKFKICTGDTNAGTLLSQALTAEVSGTETINSEFHNAIKANLTAETERVTLFGVGGSSGELQSGSMIVITVNWKTAADSDSATSFTCASSVNLGEELTIKGTAALSSYTHTLTIKFGSATKSGSITSDGTTVANGIVGSVTPPASFANQIPDKASGTATVTLTTKKGSTTIGSKSKNVTVVVPDTDEYRPTIGTISIAPQRRGNIGGTNYTLQNYSFANISATASAKYGATLKNIAFFGQDIDKKSYGSDTSLTGTRSTGVFSVAGTFTYTITATDSRGRTKTVTSDPITVTAYNRPSYQSLSVSRCTSGGDLTPTGMYGVVRGSVSYTPVGSNQMNVKIEVKNTDEAYPTTPLYTGAFSNGWILQDSQHRLYELSAANRYTARFTFSDEVVTLDPVEVNIPAAYILMRWEPQNSAFGYGCYPTGKKRVEIADDWGLYHKGVDILSVLSTHEWLSCPVLWESTAAWSSGTLTEVTKDLSEWQVVEAVISSGATGILTKGDNNIFRGVCFGGADGGFIAYMIIITRNSATSLTMNRFEQVQVSHSKSPTVGPIPTPTTPNGVVKLIGIKHV